MVFQIINIEPSNRKNKRFVVTLNTEEKIHFGLRDGQTFIDHHDPDRRNAYIARHYANPKEKALIDDLTPSPALLSLYLLWGHFNSIQKNIDYLNKEWQKHQ
jgi:hypothetical protein